MMLPSLLLGLSFAPWNSLPVSLASEVRASPESRIVEPEAGLVPALSLLKKTVRGSQILKQAEQMRIPLELGDVSRTDVTASRMAGGKAEPFRFNVRVVISREKEPVFQAMDLAHELIHAFGPKVNPFDPQLDPLTYVRRGIEGPGGEVEAIRSECAVGRELLDAGTQKLQVKGDSLQLVKARCVAAWKSKDEPLKWVKNFYNLGHFHDDFVSTVSTLNLTTEERIRWRGQVGTRSPMFSSAVTHKPYPLALLEEYIQITRQVCEKAKDRIRSGRSLASESPLFGRCDTVGVRIRP
jgi:hypothetical protein